MDKYISVLISFYECISFYPGRGNTRYKSKTPKMPGFAFFQAITAIFYTFFVASPSEVKAIGETRASVF